MEITLPHQISNCVFCTAMHLGSVTMFLFGITYLKVIHGIWDYGCQYGSKWAQTAEKLLRLNLTKNMMVLISTCNLLQLFRCVTIVKNIGWLKAGLRRSGPRVKWQLKSVTKLSIFAWRQVWVTIKLPNRVIFK